MNANELMIGDWVMIKDYPMRSMPKKVREEHFVRSLVEFEPISLTEEILKANGFEIPKHMYMYEMVYQGMKIRFCDFKLEVYESALFNPGLISEMRPINNYKYVHELQHALRLCGLNELADNFKIN